MKKIAIITARAGSKGLPNKNVLLANGKPLMAYSIEAAIESGNLRKLSLVLIPKNILICSHIIQLNLLNVPSI